jgi:manganese oxidase
MRHPLHRATYVPSRWRNVAGASALLVLTGALSGLGCAGPRQEAGGRTGAGGTGTTAILASENRHPAGTLRDGVLTVRLIAADGAWYPEGPGRVALEVEAFGEEGGPLTAPGPLLRVPAGTVIHASVRNATAAGDTLVVWGLGERPAAAAEPVRIPPGVTVELRFPAPAPGTYFYAASTTGAAVPERYGRDAQLHGALVVDPAGHTAAPADRPMIISWWMQFAEPEPGPESAPERGTMAINGRTWPYTERFHVAVHDTLTWRWINLTDAPHPMHLHGFYFRVDAVGDNAADTVYAPAARRLAVTETVWPYRTATTTWAPDRPGNWLFHCHFAFHISSHLSLGEADARAHAPSSHRHEHGHAGDGHGMAGLVLGIEAAPGLGYAPPDYHRARPLRLIVSSEGGPGAPLRFGYHLHDGGPEPGGARAPGPVLVLAQHEPVAITVVNRSAQRAAVHWHGIELESFADGVPGWSGDPGRLFRPIAPQDSFVARFIPPRAGTFMYHSHFNELEQLGRGLYGAIVVTPDGRMDPARDHLVIISDAAPDRPGPPTPLVNGHPEPPGITLTGGEPNRLRLVNITAMDIAVLRLVRDGEPLAWAPVAKDGADLPRHQSEPGPAVARIGAGEILDVEVTLAAGESAELRIHRGRRTVVVPVRAH